MSGIRWSISDYAEWLNRQATRADRAAVSAAYPKRDIPDALDAALPPIPLDSKFRVRVVSRGRRLADTDGNSVKAVLDGITKAGLWPDDSSKFIEEISFTQEIAEQDETVIEVFCFTVGV